jgi:hypothetical protein
MVQVHIPRSTYVRSWAPEIYANDRWVRSDHRFATRPEAATAAMAWMAHATAAIDYQAAATRDEVNSRWSYSLTKPVSSRRSWRVKGLDARFFTHAEAVSAAESFEDDEDGTVPEVHGSDDLPTHTYDFDVGVIELVPGEVTRRLEREAR